MITTTRTCDKCKEVIKDSEPYWIIEKELRNSPEDMDDYGELDYEHQLCLKCVPLGEYKKIEVKK